LLKNNAFQWCEEAATTFEELKNAMCTTPILIMPDFTKHFILETDACDKSIEAVLMQGKQLIAFLSKVLGIKN
jgi:RNase H-like domain found in reverse transcriptase